jgi:uncharacterized protein YegL
VADTAETPGTNDIKEILAGLRKHVIVVLLMIDVSGSMRGARIGAVNDAIGKALPDLKKYESENSGTEIRVAIMEFSSVSRWKTPAPEPVSSFHYDDIQETGGGTNYGKALAALSEFLSRKDFLNSPDVHAPVIVILTDGKPSDKALYGEELRALMSNVWFRRAARAGLAVEEGAESPECRQALVEFTGGESMVFLAKDLRKLEGQVRFVIMAGVDAITKQGAVRNEPDCRDGELESFFANPPSRAEDISGIDIPGLDEIDWEHDFPPFG